MSVNDSGDNIGGGGLLESGALGDGNLRAAVLGVNDGLVSNFSLVMGVAGGTADPKWILLAGVAGLLAGSFSMAAGEYISVASQREVYENRIRTESAIIARSPETQERRLGLIYESKGLTADEAREVAGRIMEDPEVALDTITREGLGLDQESLGSPLGAASSSFVAFVIGAIVPILPYLLGIGEFAFVSSAALSGVALAVVGALVAAGSGRNLAWGAGRMFLIGGLAAAVTYGVGRIIGVAVG